MPPNDSTARENQRRRTRKDLLQAAARLMKEGHLPTLDDVAEAALVSRATVYRYFSNIESLLVEAPIEGAMPDADTFFPDDATVDPIARMTTVDAAVESVIAANEPAMRMLLMNSLQLRLKNRDQNAPARQNRRAPLIAAALRPTEDLFEPTAFDMLNKALALAIGPEAMVVFKDVLQIDEAEARVVRRWMIRALITAAMKPASPTDNGG